MHKIILTFVLLPLTFLLLASCAATPNDGFVVSNPPTKRIIRIGLLLPLSAQNSEIKNLARSLSDAAQMALFDSTPTRLALVPQDTKGTKIGALKAMELAVKKNVDIILGPLLASSVEAITPLAQQNNIPIIAFSSDERIVKNNIYLLGFSPRQQVRTIIKHAKNLGVRRIAAFLPRTDYGRLVRDVFVKASSAGGMEIHAIETYAPNIEKAMGPASRLADYGWRRKAREQEMRRLERVVARAKTELRLRGPQAEARRFVRGRAVRTASKALPPQVRLEQTQAQIKRLKKIDALGEVPYQAILFAEGGNLLRGLVQLLPNFDITTKQVFFLGTGLWDDPKLSREQPLNGARFAAPPFDNASILLARMRQQYRRPTKRLATLGYDAVGFVSALAAQSDPPFEYNQITQSEGFVGVDGIFRFTKDFSNNIGKNKKLIKGAVAQRGLAVIEIRRRTREIIAKAPDEFKN